MKFYLALDGTGDVTQRTRCERAALIGEFCLVALLPEGRDPDEMTAAEIAQAKGDARPVLTEWLSLLEGLQGQEKRDSRNRLFEFLKQWSIDDPAGAGDRRTMACAELNLNEAEYTAALEGKGAAPAGRQAAAEPDQGGEQPAALPVMPDRRQRMNSRFPSQPEALGRPPAGDVEREEIANFYREYRLVPDKDKLDAICGNADKIKELAELKTLDRERLRLRRAMAAFMERKNAGATGEEPPAKMEEEKASRLDELREIWDANEESVNVAMNTDAIRSQIRAVMRGWPMRLVSGSLFVDDDRTTVQKGQDGATDTSLSAQFGPPVRMVDDATRFLSLIHDYGRVRFNRGQDVDKCNYVGAETLFSNLCSAPDVPLWLEIERYPHEPALPGHYYAWRPEDDDDYKPTGEKLAELIGFFDNIREPWHRAVFAAAIVTPFWGGAYGARPFLFFWANGQGSGKSTAAEMITNLVGGYAAINFGQRDEERLKERILSDEFSGTRCLLADNVVGKADSPLLAELATASRISDKKLAVGEAWRPNSLCVFLTGNNPQLGKDLVVRTFFVKFEPIEEIGKDVGQRVDWKAKLRDFIKENARKIMADCLAILAAKKPAIDWAGVTAERNADWAAEVLAAVIANEHIKKKIGDIPVKDVLLRNQAYRESVDEELDEALRFMQALLERVCQWNRFCLAGENNSLVNIWPRDPVFIRASAKEKDSGDDGDDHESRQNITTVWRSTIRGDVNPTWVGRRVNLHIEGGRLKGLTPYRSSTKRGYRLDPELIVRFLAERAGREPHAVVEVWRDWAENPPNDSTSTGPDMTT